jgi:hypothetical protein
MILGITGDRNTAAIGADDLAFRDCLFRVVGTLTLDVGFQNL